MSIINKDRTVVAKKVVEGAIKHLPSPYILVYDTGMANNLAAAINILAGSGYEVVSNSYSESGHFVVMKIAEH
jgi:hypothetical protein